MGRYAYFNRIHELFGSDKIHTFEIGHTKGRSSLDGVVAIGDGINLEAFSAVPGWRGFRKEVQIVITDDWAKSASSSAPYSPDDLNKQDMQAATTNSGQTPQAVYLPAAQDTSDNIVARIVQDILKAKYPKVEDIPESLIEQKVEEIVAYWEKLDEQHNPNNFKYFNSPENKDEHLAYQTQEAKRQLREKLNALLPVSVDQAITPDKKPLHQQKQVQGGDALHINFNSSAKVYVNTRTGDLVIKTDRVISIPKIGELPEYKRVGQYNWYPDNEQEKRLIGLQKGASLNVWDKPLMVNGDEGSKIVVSATLQVITLSGEDMFYDVHLNKNGEWIIEKKV